MITAELLSRIKPGVCATLWTPAPMSETLTPVVRRILSRVRPQIVCLHGMPESLYLYGRQVWTEIQTLVDGWTPRLWIGVACDTKIALAARHRRSAGNASLDLWESAQIADQLGAELVMWNAEAACKIDATIAGQVATSLIDYTRKNFPALVQGHTAYSRVMSHRDYPWQAWYGDTGVDVAFPQNYVAPEQPADGSRGMASPGSLKRRLALDHESWEQAVTEGLIRGSLVRWPYLQLHHVPFVQTATYGAGQAWAGWALEKHRCDADGETALAISAELYRRGQSVSKFQRAAGIRVDGIAGPETKLALGI